MSFLQKIKRLVGDGLYQVSEYLTRAEEISDTVDGVPGDGGSFINFGDFEDIFHDEDAVMVDATWRHEDSGLPKLIAPGETVQIQSSVDGHAFKGCDFIIAPHLARFFDIHSIKVGRDEQLFCTSPLMGSGFSASFDGRPALNMKECPSALQITTTVRNVGDKAHLFKAFFVGGIPERPPAVGKTVKRSARR
jgi:hypothetical protein